MLSNALIDRNTSPPNVSLFAFYSTILKEYIRVNLLKLAPSQPLAKPPSELVAHLSLVGAAAAGSTLSPIGPL